MKGELSGVLKSVGTLLFTAPVTNPQSVGLAEIYVQLILAGLRAQLALIPENMDRWDEYLDSVVQAINMRVLHVSCSWDLMFGFIRQM